MRRIFIGLMVVALAGCGGASTKEQIIGRWQTEDGDLTITYTPTGIVYFEGASSFGCYSVAGDVITLTLADSTPFALTAKFDGADKMTTTGDGGDRVYKRLNSTGTLSEKANLLKVQNALSDNPKPVTDCPAP